MNYRSRIKILEKKVNRIDVSGKHVFSNSVNLIGKKINLLKLSEVKDRILAYYKINKSNNTFLSYRNSYKNFVRLIGDKMIQSINRDDLEEFKIKRCHEVNSVSTNIDIRNIKAMFNKMVDLNLIESSDLNKVSQFRIDKKKILAIDSSDVINIINSIEDPQLKQIVRFTLLTSSRISEVLNVRIKDIDFKNGLINIYQQKTNSFKTIPLEDNIKNLVLEIMESNLLEKNINELPKDSFLFYSKFKNDLLANLRADTTSKKFKKVLRKLSLNTDFKFHSLRHTAITQLLLNNVPLNVVKEIAGHKSVTTTMLYSHVKSSDMKNAVNSLSY